MSPLTTHEILRISLVQTDIVWEDIAANRARLSTQLAQFHEQTDILILPEMFTTGFSMAPEQLAETMRGETVQWMQAQAAAHQCLVMGSLIIHENDNYYNRLLVMSATGCVMQYNKRHLFRMANEHHHYSKGMQREIITVKGWRICPLICYDLRFPVWSRNNNDYDLLIYIANWPESRRFAWQTLAAARAIENQSYVATVNRVGRDGHHVRYGGDSAVYHPQGQVLSIIKGNEICIDTVELSMPILEKLRRAFPVSCDADEFALLTN